MNDITVDINDFFYAKKPVRKAVEEKREEVHDVKFTIIKIAAILLAVLVLAEIVIYKVLNPLMTAPVLNFSGTKYLRDDVLAAKINELEMKSWFSFDADKAASALSSISSVENVSVRKQFPDKVFIELTERVPVAKSIVLANGVSESVQIDKNGVIFSLKSTSFDVQDPSVPLISGLPLENLKEGMRLPQKYRALMDQISTIKDLPQKYFAAISEIQVVPNEYGNYELTLYPVKSRVRVLTDRVLNEEALKYMLVVLDVADAIARNATEIDLRYGVVSFR